MDGPGSATSVTTATVESPALVLKVMAAENRPTGASLRSNATARSTLLNGGTVPVSGLAATRGFEVLAAYRSGLPPLLPMISRATLAILPKSTIVVLSRSRAAPPATIVVVTVVGVVVEELSRVVRSGLRPVGTVDVGVVTGERGAPGSIPRVGVPPAFGLSTAGWWMAAIT